jgi:hypothetical protein
VSDNRDEVQYRDYTVRVSSIGWSVYKGAVCLAAGGSLNGKKTNLSHGLRAARELETGARKPLVGVQ